MAVKVDLLATMSVYIRVKNYVFFRWDKKQRPYHDNCPLSSLGRAFP